MSLAPARVFLFISTSVTSQISLMWHKFKGVRTKTIKPMEVVLLLFMPIASSTAFNS